MSDADAISSRGDIERSCPRCGYDQTGALATMIESCPLEGRCVECGLVFRWGELASGRLSSPRWLVEHAPTGRVPVALVVTMLAATFGMPLWRALRMVNPIVPRRLFLLMVASIVGTWLVVVGPMVLETHRRIDALSRGSWGVEPPSIAAWAGALARAAILPLSDEPHRLTRPTAPLPFATIASPRRMLAESVTPVLASAYGLTYAAAAASAVAFLALPFARRRAKVQGKHLARCLIYLLATMPAVALAIQLLQPRSPWWGPRGGGAALAAFDDPRVLAAWLVWLVLWWWSATSLYLGMRRPWLVAIAVATIGILVAGACAVMWP